MRVVNLLWLIEFNGALNTMANLIKAWAFSCQKWQKTQLDKQLSNANCQLSMAQSVHFFCKNTHMKLNLRVTTYHNTAKIVKYQHPY